MRFTMHGGCPLRTRCAAEAENFAAALVEPVFVILDAILLLRFDIRAVRLRNVFRGSSGDLVDVHIHRHVDLSKSVTSRRLC